MASTSRNPTRGCQYQTRSESGMFRRNKTSAFSSLAFTGTMTLETESLILELPVSRLAESTLRHSLPRSQRLTLTIDSGQTATPPNVTQWAPVQDGIPKSPSTPPSAWSHQDRPSSGTAGKSAEPLGTPTRIHRVARGVTDHTWYKMLTPSEKGTLATMILYDAYSGQGLIPMEETSST